MDSRISGMHAGHNRQFRMLFKRMHPGLNVDASLPFAARIAPHEKGRSLGPFPRVASLRARDLWSRRRGRWLFSLTLPQGIENASALPQRAWRLLRWRSLDDGRGLSVPTGEDGQHQAGREENPCQYRGRPGKDVGRSPAREKPSRRTDAEPSPFRFLQQDNTDQGGDHHEMNDDEWTVCMNSARTDLAKGPCSLPAAHIGSRRPALHDPRRNFHCSGHRLGEISEIFVGFGIFAVIRRTSEDRRLDDRKCSDTPRTPSRTRRGPDRQGLAMTDRIPGFATLAIHAARNPIPRPARARLRFIRRRPSYLRTSTMPPPCSACNLSVTSTPASAILPTQCWRSVSRHLKAAPPGLRSHPGTRLRSIVMHCLMKPGDEFVASKKLYGGSINQFNHAFKNFGWNVVWAEPDESELSNAQ